MNLAPLLKKLMDIEQAIGTQELRTVRKMVIDSQEWVLEMQKQSVDGSRIEPGPIRLVARMVGTKT
jgi:hypothetical protein